MVALDKARGQAHAAAEVLKEEIEKVGDKQTFTYLLIFFSDFQIEGLNFKQLQNEIVMHEKRHKQYEKIIEDWKKKVEDLQTELEEANKEAKVEAEETVKVGHQLDEAKELSERLKRENKNLSGNWIFVH